MCCARFTRATRDCLERCYRDQLNAIDSRGRAVVAGVPIGRTLVHEVFFRLDSTTSAPPWFPGRLIRRLAAGDRYARNQAIGLRPAAAAEVSIADDGAVPSDRGAAYDLETAEWTPA
jgi:hypothetical protein